jgi:hypothetical protein
MNKTTLKHIVLWKLKENFDKETNAIRLKELLDRCQSIVPGILKFEVVISQPDLEATHDLILNSEFTSRSALEEYQKHPTHTSIKPFIRTIQESRQCMDYMS